VPVGDYTPLSIEKFYNDIDSKLTNFLTAATQSTREKHSKKKLTESFSNFEMKRVHLFFIMCNLMHTTNSNFLTPFHNILADIVVCSGGSRELLKVLNRLGCTSSPDSYDRYVTYNAECQREKSIGEMLQKNVFTVASVDNFDMLQTHAAVYHNKERSYHGTTVQVVQPNAQCIIDHSLINTQTCPQSSSSICAYSHDSTTCITTTQGSITVNEPTQHATRQQPVAIPPITTLVRRRSRTHSPSSSPHKNGKDGPKKRRTVAVKDLTKTLNIHAHLPSNSTYYDSSPYTNLSLQNFHLSESFIKTCSKRKKSHIIRYALLY
jgi:hypothetical protein